jgi:uncharacterized protein YjlB
MEIEDILHMNITRHLLTDDGQFPNNALYPLLVYPKVIKLDEDDPAGKLKELFKVNDWKNSWTDSVYDFHHYHSTAHEVLGVIKGSGRVEFGGPSGITLLLEQGDLVVIPAGVAHKAIDLYDDFTVVGAYPIGQEYDMNYGKPEERDQAVENIRSVAKPLTDPIYGTEGPLLVNWEVVH